MGVTYLWVLLALVLLTLGIGKSLDVYSAKVQRQKEKELILVGELYKKAIKDYYLSTPGGIHKFPEKLEDLTRDRRHIVIRRYIRKIYLDPMTGKPLALIVAPEGGIMGVKSTSTKHPLRHYQASKFSSVTDIKTYQDWHFIAEINLN